MLFVENFAIKCKAENELAKMLADLRFVSKPEGA
jgi:hypothetical protein